MIRAVIFDIDGTLIDSVDFHAKSWQEAFEHFGKHFSFEVVRSQIGKGGDQLLPVFLSEAEQKQVGAKLEQYRSDLFKKKYLSLIKPFAQVRELFQRIDCSGKHIALASSAKEDELKVYERIAHIEDLVEEKTSSDDAERSKPHPDIVEAALEKLGKPRKDEAVMVGDTPYDAIAARRAGIRCIGVLCGGFPQQELEAEGCVEIYKDPADLLNHYADSLIERDSN